MVIRETQFKLDNYSVLLYFLRVEHFHQYAAKLSAIQFEQMHLKGLHRQKHQLAYSDL